MVCGNNILEAGEECDDGNILNGDACSAACILEVPSATLLAIPDNGFAPLDSVLVATKDSRASYISLDLGDGSSLISTPSFPTPYTYSSTGTYT